MNINHQEKCIVSFIICLTFTLLPSQIVYADSESLAGYQTQYNNELSKIDAACDASRQTALDSYGKHLENVKEKLTHQGDLEGTLVLNKEIERFDKQKTIPLEPPAGLPSFLLSAQKQYSETLLSAERVKIRKTVSLMRRHLIRLEAFKKRLVRQEQLDQANEVANAIEKMTSALQELELRLPKSETKPAEISGDHLAELQRKGLVMYMPFSKDQADSITDMSGKNNHGKALGGKWISKGKVGGAYMFDGKNDIIKTDLLTDQRSVTKGATYALWVYPTIQSGKLNRQVISTGNGGCDWSLLHYMANWMIFTGDGPFDTKVPVTLNKWQHLAIVFDNKYGISFYVDGHKVAATKIGHEDSTAPITLGENPNIQYQEPYGGMIDEVMIFDRPLADRDIQKIYEASK